MGNVNNALSVMLHTTTDPNVFKFQTSNHAWLTHVTGTTKFLIQTDTAVIVQFALNLTLTRLNAYRSITLTFV